MARWGLVGEWALDCKVAPKDIGTSHLVYEVRQGKPVHYRIMPQKEEPYALSRAMVAPDGSLEIQINFGGEIGRREMRFVRGPDNRIKTQSNRRADGKYVIFDGKFVDGGAPVAWLSKCR